jgi:ABC-type glycerol-3-phosphate transport system permease component
MTKVRAVTKTLGIHTTLILTIIISSVPFYWAAQTSIKFTRDTISKIPTLWGFDVTADPYRRFWFRNEEQNMWAVGLFFVVVAAVIALIVVARRWSETRWPFTLAILGSLWIALLVFPRVFEMNREFDFFMNSIFVTVLTVIISITIGLLAGYGLARYAGFWGAAILLVALAFRALPRTAFVLPYFVVAKDLGILDSRLVVVLALVAINQPFTIWMLRSFFMEIPREIEEAAMMDGGTRLQGLRMVVIPMMWPGIIATALFTMLLAYNEFLFVRVLTVTNWTLPVAMSALTGGESTSSLTEAAAAAVSITLPIVIVIIIFQKHLVKGLGAGAVKG